MIFVIESSRVNSAAAIISESYFIDGISAPMALNIKKRMMPQAINNAWGNILLLRIFLIMFIEVIYNLFCFFQQKTQNPYSIA